MRKGACSSLPHPSPCTCSFPPPQSLNLETRESYTLDVASPAIVIQVSAACCAVRRASACGCPPWLAFTVVGWHAPSQHARPGPAHCSAPQANSVFGALRALESLSQMLRRRRLPPGSALEALVPPEAVWPAEGEDEEQHGGEGQAAAGGAAATGQEGGAGAAGQQLPEGRRRRKKRDKTVLLVEEVDIYDAPRFRYRCAYGGGGWVRAAEWAVLRLGGAAEWAVLRLGCNRLVGCAFFHGAMMQHSWAEV